MKSLAETLATENEVFFIHGAIGNINDDQPDFKYAEIALKYSDGIFSKAINYLLKKGYHKTAKSIHLLYYFFTGETIFDLKKAFIGYLKIHDLHLSQNDILLVSFPSHTIHHLGYELRKRFGCKLILDFRDPGVYGYRAVADNRLMSFLRKTLIKNNEHKCLEAADLIITVSKSLKNFFPEKYQHKIRLIRNGALAEYIDRTKRANPDKFRIMYLGTMYNAQLKDDTFFRTVYAFVKNSILPVEFELFF